MAPHPPLPFEKLLELLQNYDKSPDGTIGSEEVSKLIRALDSNNFWNEARLQSLMEGFGLSKGRVKLESFARILYDGPEAAVYEVVREDLRKAMISPEWDDGSYAPILIRLAWHSSGTYCPVMGGGSNGATMRHAKEANDPENKYLEHARALLDPIKAKHPWISHADLWILASYVALETTAGPRIKFTGGRTDAPAEKAVDPGRLPEAEHGLAPGMEVDEEGRLKGWENVAAHVRAIFGRMGFNDREAVALLCGGHVYGRCHPQESGSGYAGAWVENPTMFSNEYAADMVGDKWIAVTHDTVMPDGGQVPEEVRPAPGKRQYIDLSKYEGEDSGSEAEAPRAPPALEAFGPGRYKCLSQWVNCREEMDISSPVVGRFLENQELSIVAVKVCEMEIRGLAERGGWVSIANSSGKTLWERQGDLKAASLQGRYRAVKSGGALVFPDASAASESVGRMQAGDEFEVDHVVLPEGGRGVIMGRLKSRSGYVLIYGSEGLQCEKIVEGYNEKPRRPLKGQTGHQMMLVSDMVLLWDAAFRPHLEVFAEDEELLKKEFGEAFKKLTELGCPWAEGGACPVAA